MAYEEKDSWFTPNACGSNYRAHGSAFLQVRHPVMSKTCATSFEFL